MRKEKRTIREIKRDVYKRLLNYGKSEQNMKKIYSILKKDPKSRILYEPKGKGWVTIDKIERKPLPYGSPRGHRYEYLNDPLIEKAAFKYYVRKNPAKPNRNAFSETVYRLKRNRSTFYALQKIIDYKTFVKSTYTYDLEIYEPATGLPMSGWHERAADYYHHIDEVDSFEQEIEFLFSQAYNSIIRHRHIEKLETLKREIEHQMTKDDLNQEAQKMGLSEWPYTPNEQKQNMFKEYPCYSYADALITLEKIAKLIQEQPEFKINKVKIERIMESKRKKKGIEPTN